MQRDETTPSPVITIDVEDINAALAEIEAAGGSTVTPRTAIPGMGAFGYFKDPEGNVMGLWETDDRTADVDSSGRLVTSASSSGACLHRTLRVLQSRAPGCRVQRRSRAADQSGSPFPARHTTPSDRTTLDGHNGAVRSGHDLPRLLRHRRARHRRTLVAARPGAGCDNRGGLR